MNIENKLKNTSIEYFSPRELDDKIVKFIQKREYSKIQRLKYFSYSLGILSAVLMYPVINSLIKTLTSSGFFEYFTTFVSDPVASLSIWKNILYLFIDILPITNIILGLILVVSLLYSVRLIGKTLTFKNI